MFTAIDAKSLWSYNPIPNGCQLYLPLWALKGNNFKSVDPYGRACIVTEAELQSKGRYFDGTNDEITGSFGVLSGLTAFTVLVWTNYTDPSTDQAFYGEIISGGAALFKLFGGAIATGRIDFWYSDQVNPTMQIVSADVYNDGAWHFIACVRLAANSWELLVDTVSKGTDATNIVAGTSNVMAVGRVAETAATFLTCTVGEVAIYNRALSISEQSYYYNMTKGRYL